MGQSKKDYEKTLPVLGKKEYEKEMQYMAFMIERQSKPTINQKKK